MNGDNHPQTFRTLSTKVPVSTPRRGPHGQSSSVALKQKKSPYKAARKVPDPIAKRVRVTERRAKCMETSSKLSKYFRKSPGFNSGLPDPICLSSDDGSPGVSSSVLTQRVYSKKVGRPASRFIDSEAHCSSDSDQALYSEADEEEEGGSTPWVVSDGHLSSDESDDWAAVQCARRIGTQPSSPSPTRLRFSKEVEKEQESQSDTELCEMEWTIGAQPLSPPMTPINLEDDIPLCSSPDREEVEPDTLPVVVEEPGVEVPTDNPNFKLQYRYLLLTYKGHLDKVKYIEWFKDLYPTNKQEGIWLRLAYETADAKCPYIHTHVVIDLGYRPCFKSPHKFCYRDPDVPEGYKWDNCKAIHCNIKGLPGDMAFVDAKKYIGKEDRANADLLVPVENEKGLRIVQRIQGSPSVNQALRKNLRRIGDAAGIIQIYGCRPLVTEDLVVPPRPHFPWHNDLFAQVENKTCPPWDRKIIWYVDKVGNTGKSWFSKYIASNGVTEETGFDWLCMTAVKEKHDAFHQIRESIDLGFKKTGFIIDVSRASKFKQALYEVLEDIKNGQVTSTKYKGANLKFNTPWVIVFANFWPKTHMMSTDRWDIRRITTETKVAEHLPFDAEAPEEFKHCTTCQCAQHQTGRRHDILQERV